MNIYLGLFFFNCPLIKFYNLFGGSLNSVIRFIVTYW